MWAKDMRVSTVGTKGMGVEGSKVGGIEFISLGGVKISKD